MFTGAYWGEFEPKQSEHSQARQEREDGVRAHDRCCRAWLGDQCGCRRQPEEESDIEMARRLR